MHLWQCVLMIPPPLQTDTITSLMQWMPFSVTWMHHQHPSTGERAIKDYEVSSSDCKTFFVCCFCSKEIVKMSSAYTTLTIGDKADIIDLLETRSPASLAGEYNVSVSTIYQIRAKKKEILEAAKRSLIHKRIVETKYPVVEQFLLEWVEQARMKNLIISDDILQTQALQFAREQHMDDFKASEKWVLGFKKKWDQVPFSPG